MYTLYCACLHLYDNALCCRIWRQCNARPQKSAVADSRYNCTAETDGLATERLPCINMYSHTTDIAEQVSEHTRHVTLLLTIGAASESVAKAWGVYHQILFRLCLQLFSF
jgi:hypothetical protein